MTLDFAHVLYQFNYDCDHIGTFENARTQLSLFMVDPIHTRFRKVFIILQMQSTITANCGARMITESKTKLYLFIAP